MVDATVYEVDGWQLRPNTCDHEIWQEVVEGNSYQLPDALPGAAVLDIGACFGAFGAACIRRGATHVWSYEPGYENYVALRENMVRVPVDTVIHQLAVWRSDDWFGTVSLSGSDPVVTGARSTCFHSPAEATLWVPLDTILGFYPVDLMKLDCEGAEFPILYSSKDFRQVPHIVGESHELPREQWRCDYPGDWPAPTHEALEHFLTKHGYAVEWFGDPTDPVVRIFVARKGV